MAVQQLFRPGIPRSLAEQGWAKRGWAKRGWAKQHRADRGRANRQAARDWGRRGVATGLATLVIWAFLGAGAPLTVGAAGAGGPEPGGAKTESSDDLLSEFDQPLPGNPAAGEEDLSAGFSAELPVTGKSAQTLDQPEQPAASFMTWNGFLRQGASYNYARETAGPGTADFRGLNHLRTTLRLGSTLRLGGGWRGFVSAQGSYDAAYDLKGTENYAPEVLDAYQQEGEVREAYLAGSLARSLDLKIGRQIVVWGKSDVIRVVDVLNPLDFREPGLTTLEDLRLPLTMTRVDYFLGNWSLQAVAVHEIEFDRLPPANSEYSPLTTPIPEEIPSDGGANTEYGLSLAGTFSGWDVALYWADVFADRPWADLSNPASITARFSRLKMVGVGANVAAGPWLLKSEAATFSGVAFSWFDPAPPASATGQFDRTDVLVGFDYSGIRDTTLSLEVVNQGYRNFESALENPPNYARENQQQAVLSYRGAFLREKLNLAANISTFSAQGGFQRYQAAYELAAATILTGGVLIYDGGDGSNPTLAAFEDNDRIFLDLKWAF